MLTLQRKNKTYPVTHTCPEPEQRHTEPPLTPYFEAVGIPDLYRDMLLNYSHCFQGRNYFLLDSQRIEIGKKYNASTSKQMHLEVFQGPIHLFGCLITDPQMDGAIKKKKIVQKLSKLYGHRKSQFRNPHQNVTPAIMLLIRN